MSGISAIVDTAISDFKKEIEDKVEQNCKVYCKEILAEALRWRTTQNLGHNFTGNLVNSIVVCLYKHGKPLEAYYASGKVKSPIHVKMTASRKRYVFYQDWDGVASVYEPEIKTDEGYGDDDAEKFFSSFRPHASNLFDIVVAYPVEYAEFVEMRRQTTGYMNTFNYAANVGLQYLTI